jgi:hypothetical protein
MLYLWVIVARKLPPVIDLARLVKYLSVIVLVTCSFGFTQNFDTNAKIKAVFLYNFTRYFEWPDAKKSGNFVIQVVGKNEALIKELTKMAETKTVGSQKMEVVNTPAYDGKSKPHMLFLLPDVSKVLPDATSKLKGKGSLIIAENAGAAKSGAAINFVIIDNKQKFEYSKASAVKAGLKTSEDFKALAIAVD